MNANSHTIIPDNESHCVWMDAGLVNYKLCTCRFECDDCPFDAVMREQHQTFAQRAARLSGEYQPESAEPAVDVTADPVDRMLQQLLAVPVPQDRIYFSNHTWMRPLELGIFQMGIDAFAAHLLQPVASVASLHAPAHIGRGEPYVWLIRDSATVAVHNNERGTLCRVNSRLNDQPSLLTADPYGEGWLISIDCSNGPALSELRSRTADEHRAALRTETASLAAELHKGRHSVGTTMYDGGRRLESIEEFIGEKRYSKLLTRLLGPHSA